MNWTDKDYSIFVQSLCRHWIGPEDSPASVRHKVGEMFRLATVDLPKLAGQSSEKPALSKQMETKIIKAMEKAIEADDLAGVWELWNELDEDEKGHMNSMIDRNRRSRWKKAILEAAAMVRESDTPEPTFPRDFL